MKLNTFHSIKEIDPLEWNSIQAPNFPFASYEFLQALEESDSLGERTGWFPLFITLHNKGVICGALYLYLKNNSYGEYIFDWSWASAWQKYGMAYYPKLTSAIPFTPATGPKILVSEHCDKKEVADNLKKLGAEKVLKIFTGDEKNFSKYNFYKEIVELKNITSVIHFAALKSIPESLENPLGYYDNNVVGTISLLKAIKNNGVKNFVFSSSCSVYGQPEIYPVNELTPVKKSESPYGETKSMCEKVLLDHSSSSDLKIVVLRYFNPIGSHSSGLLKENPKNKAGNLMPIIIDVINDKEKKLTDDQEVTILNLLKNEFNSVKNRDTHIGGRGLSLKNRVGSLKLIWNDFKKAENYSMSSKMIYLQLPNFLNYKQTRVL